MAEKIIEVVNLGTRFKTERGVLKAIDGVSFDVYRGEMLGIVGESGCGKSTTGRTILRLIEKTDGEILFNGEDISKYDKKQLRDLRTKMQIIFQDPYASLDPRMTVGDIIGEALDIHKMYSSKAERRDKINALLDIVGLNTEHANRFAHEFSGGQRQRIGIARALAVDPEFIVCDEPISALDVSIQAQVVNMLEDLQADRGFTYLFIAHDLSMVKHISDRVGVMYLGNFVEVGEKEKIYSNPMHPYTQALLSAVPVPDPTAKRERILLEGSIPSAHKPPTGCKFHTRCPKCMECCKTQAPERYEVDDGHYVYCHLYDKERRKQQK